MMDFGEGPFWESIVRAWGRSESLAHIIDGQYGMSHRHPAVNPDRHARIRARHFHSSFVRAAYEEELTRAQWERKMSFLDAHEHSAWGCS